MHDLSKVDRRILALLQQDGRLSVAEIGRRVGLTPLPAPIESNDSNRWG